MAGSNNVKTFASAQIFYSAGSTGLQILIQIFVADTSDLLNRALFSSLPDVPFLITVWVGPPIANSLLAHTTWRWGYGYVHFGAIPYHLAASWGHIPSFWKQKVSSVFRIGLLIQVECHVSAAKRSFCSSNASFFSVFVLGSFPPKETTLAPKYASVRRFRSRSSYCVPDLELQDIVRVSSFVPTPAAYSVDTISLPRTSNTDSKMCVVYGPSSCRQLSCRWL